MNLSRKSRYLHSFERGVSAYVPITHFNSPTVLETKDGMIFSVIKLEGIPFETEKTANLNYYRDHLHRALSSLNSSFSVMGTLHRRKVDFTLNSTFNNKLARKIDSLYMKQFTSSEHYSNDLYLTVISKGIMGTFKTPLLRLFLRVGRQITSTQRDVIRQDAVFELERVTNQLLQLLSDFQPYLLGSCDKQLGYSELLQYLGLFLNAGGETRVSAEEWYPPINNHINTPTKDVQLYPKGNVSQYISKKRIFFGDYIQFQSANQDDSVFASIITIKRYPSSTSSLMLDPVLMLNCEFISTHLFLIESKTSIDKAIKRHELKLYNADDPSHSQLSSLTHARDMLASDKMVMGYHQNTVMVFADSIEKLEIKTNDVIKCYMQVGIIAVRETLAQEPAFWSQFVGNSKFMVRSSLISSLNFVDFFPLHNYLKGEYNHNYLGKALTLVETRSKTPMWFNLHSSGTKDNPTSGHTIIVGGNGSGKTATICFIDSQFNRYQGASFFFDRNRGAELYIRASGGSYAVLSPDHAHFSHFNPLSLSDTPANRKFCKEWLIQLVLGEDESQLDDITANQLRRCVDYAYDQLLENYRTLSHITKLLPDNFTRWPSLRKWLKGEGSLLDGEYAYLFDNEQDTFTLNHKMGFDMTHFLDNEPPNVLTAVTMYLFHRIESSLESRNAVMSVFLDEAWQYLDNAYWKNKISKWLPTLRKMNCHLVLATQSSRTIAESALSHVILDNCASLLFFPNPQAREIDYATGFNLNKAEIEAIRQNDTSSRFFLYKQAHGSCLVRFNFTSLGKYLHLLSSSKKTNRVLARLMIKRGLDPANWLEELLDEV